MAQQVNIQVTIAGERISPLAHLDIQQGLFNHNIIQLLLPLDALQNNNTQILNQAKGFLNQPITLEITSGVFDLLNRNLTFEGIVTDVRMARYQRGAKMVYVTAYSPTFHLSGIPTTRSFHEMNLSDIANIVLQDVPGNMKTQVSPRYTQTLEYVVQYRETNLQFLQRLADAYGEWLYYDGDKLIFGQLPTNDPIDLPLEKDLLEMNLSMRVVPVNFKAKAYDYLKHEVYESTATPSEITDLDAFGEEILSQHEPQVFPGSALRMPHQAFQSAQELDEHARHEMATHSREMVVLSGTTDNIQLRVGSVINITGEKANEVDLDQYIITRVSHSMDQNFSYTNTFQAIPANAASPPANLQVRFPFCETQQATVVDNNDPEGLGRVRLNFKWMDDGQQSPWARLIQPYAGQEKDELHGFFFTPEMGDEVLVGFIHDNPDLPFVMGSVYRHHEGNHPQEWHDSDTKRKVLKTRDGNHIELIDGDKKIRIYNDSGTINEISLDASQKVITLTNANENVVTLSNGQSISIVNVSKNSFNMKDGKEITLTSQDGKIIIQAKEIEILADEKMSLKSKDIDIVGEKSVTVHSDQKVEMSSGKEMNLSSDNTAKFSAMQSLDVDSMTANVKGSVSVNIEGLEMNVKSSAKTNIDGGAMTEIKGALLKLN